MNVLNTIGEPAALEQLAEECAELAQAALKLARVERGENPTPVHGISAICAMSLWMRRITIVVDAEGD